MADVDAVICNNHFIHYSERYKYTAQEINMSIFSLACGSVQPVMVLYPNNTEGGIMKKELIIISVFTIIISCFGCAGMQIVPVEERLLKTVHKINLTKDEIFSKCFEWMAQTFSIELKDKENGKIVGKGITSFSGGPAIFPCHFSMIVDIKDNRYRATYNNFIGMFGTSRKGPKPLEL